MYNRYTKDKKKAKHSIIESYQPQGNKAKEEERNRELQNSQKSINKMAVRTYLSILLLGLIVPIKGDRATEWMEKQDASICCLQEIHFTYKDT